MGGELGSMGGEGREGKYALRVRQALVREQEEVDEDQGFQLLRKVRVQAEEALLHAKSCPVPPCEQYERGHHHGLSI